MSSMNRIMADLKAFAKQYIRNPFGAAFSIGFPLLLLIVFGAVFSPSGTPDVHLTIQDLDGTDLSSQFSEKMNETAMNQTGVFNTYPTEPTYNMSEEIIKEFELTAALVIPAGFEADLQNSTPVDVIIYVDPSASAYGRTFDAVEKAIETFEKNQTVPVQIIGIEIADINNREFVFIEFFLPGILALAVMLNCLMILSSLAADYWGLGYFKLLKTTPLKKWEWIVSKLIWYLIIMMFAIFLMLAIGIGVFGVRASITPISILLLLAGILLFSSMGILIGALAKNTDTAAGISQAVGQPMMFLSGIFWNLENMPEAVQTIANVFPLTYLGAGLRDTMINANDGSALTNLAVVLILAVIFVMAASKLISWKEK
jgi:ABC-2 type transport system permease protein